jgi:N-acetylglucosamine transport system substrate-binding protein
MAYDGKTKWRDTFEPGILKLGQYQGKQYEMPLYFSMNGWWYDKKLFDKNGWTPPKTFSELLALCEKVKAKGIAPITFQGKYPYYMIFGFLFPWIVSSGGIEALDACQNLDPGAWKSPAVLKAAQMIAELRDRKDFQEGALGLSHTEAQQQFVTDKAAMIPCGTWLHSEMSKVTPPDFDMEFFNPPVVDGGKGDPTNVSIGIEPWVLPTKSKNLDAAIKLFKYMTSVDKAKEFVKAKGTLMAVKGSDQVEMEPYLKSAADCFRASKTVWSPDYATWYPKVHKAVQDALAALLAGEKTPEQFCDACEAAAEDARNDKDLVKRKIER